MSPEDGWAAINLENLMGESKTDALRVNFDQKLTLKFHGVKVTSEAGLLAYREIDRDVKRLSVDPAMRHVVGERAKDKMVASVSQIAMIILTTVMTATLVLAAPNGLDPETNMIMYDSGLHSVRDTMNQAAGLVSRGGPENMEIAGKMIDAVIQCQERRPDAANYGNFLWYKERGLVKLLSVTPIFSAAKKPVGCSAHRKRNVGPPVITALLLRR